MASKELKAYRVDFSPIVNGIIRPSRSVKIVAYSEKQAKKFFFDWRHNTTKIQCIFELISEEEKPNYLTSFEWNDEIKDHFAKQNKIIYGKEEIDDQQREEKN